MEPQQQDPTPHNQPLEAQQNQQQQAAQEDSSTAGSSSKSSFLCKQSSTRWTPTTDQIRILKDLYYNNGVRSPSVEQIQRISARLRQYGKIEGKNVFYWFQNHKARERQKKRFTVDLAMQRSGVGGNVVGGWKPDQDPNSTQPDNKYINNISPGATSPSSPTSPSVLGVGPMGSNMGYGSVLMEKSFRECTISQGGSTSMAVGASVSNNFGWVGMDPYPIPYPLFDKTKSSIQFFKEQSPEMETLPLFPMHGEDISGFCSGAPVPPPPPHGYYNTTTNPYRLVDDEKTGSRTSLELTLNSYTPNSPDPECSLNEM